MFKKLHRRTQSTLLAALLFGSLVLTPLMAMMGQKAFAASTNLLANPSAETMQGASPANWTPDNWGVGTTTLSVSSDAHSGTNALNVTTTARSSGDAKWMADPVAVTAGQKYTYSDYSKATVATPLVAAYTDAAGAVSYSYIGSIPPSSSWQLNSFSLTVPAGEQQVRVLHILDTVGSLTTDDFSLVSEQVVTTPPPTGNNLIADPSMETANGNAPAGWQSDSWGTNNASFSYLTNDGHTGIASAAVQVSNYASGDAKWYFTPVSVQPSTSYTFSDYYKSSVSTHMVVRFDDGTGKYSYTEILAPAASTTWAQATANFTTPATAKLVTVFHLISANGTLQIDDASVTTATQTPPPPPPTPSPGTNLISNPSVETVSATNTNLPQSWQHGSWGTNTKSYSYLATGHTGTHSVKVQMSAYTNGSAYWSPAAAPVTAGQVYDVSDYFKSNVESEVDATIIMGDGSQQYMYLGTASKSPNSWTKFRMQFIAPAGAASVVIYHNIYSVGYLTTDDYNLTQFAYQGFNRALVSITNDDGFASLYTHGLPVLQKYSLPSTAYIVSSYLDNAPYVTSAQFKNLAAAGVEIGSHSVDHADLSTLSATAQDNELKNSQSTLQNILGIPVTDYAAPYGAYNQQIVTDAQKYYQSYRGVQSGYNARNNFDVMNLQVQNIVATTTVADIQNWLQQAAATHTWLILVYHEIDTAPVDTTYNTTPTDFDSQMAAVKNSGLTVLTVSQALAEIKPQL